MEPGGRYTTLPGVTSPFSAELIGNVD